MSGRNRPVWHGAFVRNVMIGREGLHAAVLVDLFERAGADSPRSHLATGNVTFLAPPAGVAAIAADVEHGIAAVLGRREEVFVRPLDRLAGLVARAEMAPPPFAPVEGWEVTFTPLPRLDALAPGWVSPRSDWAVVAVDEGDILSAVRTVDGRRGTPNRQVERATGARASTRSIATVAALLRRPLDATS